MYKMFPQPVCMVRIPLLTGDRPRPMRRPDVEALVKDIDIRERILNKFLIRCRISFIILLILEYVLYVCIKSFVIDDMQFYKMPV